MTTVEAAAPGWFEIPGVQTGRRTLDEQMLGLHPALSEARGKEVADIGCAEGCISIEFAKAGARVYACDNQPAMVEAAQRLAADLPPEERPIFQVRDLRQMITASRAWRSGGVDIVLALAIVHKVDDPCAALEFIADSARDLVVIRLPRGYAGVLVPKHGGQTCDVARVMRRNGFELEKTFDGPRHEQVAYFRRTR